MFPRSRLTGTCTCLPSRCSATHSLSGSPHLSGPMPCPLPIPRVRAHERLLCPEVGWAPSLEAHRKLLPRGPFPERTGFLCSSPPLSSAPGPHSDCVPGGGRAGVPASSGPLPTCGHSARDLAVGARTPGLTGPLRVRLMNRAQKAGTLLRYGSHGPQSEPSRSSPGVLSARTNPTEQMGRQCQGDPRMASDLRKGWGRAGTRAEMCQLLTPSDLNRREHCSERTPHFPFISSDEATTRLLLEEATS